MVLSSKYFIQVPVNQYPFFPQDSTSCLLDFSATEQYRLKFLPSKSLKSRIDFEIGSSFMGHTNLKLETVLPQHPECWNYRQASALDVSTSYSLWVPNPYASDALPESL